MIRDVADVYDLTNRMSRSEHDTIDQLRRATKSIPANIAEGFGKKTYPREFKRFLMIALGSSDECVTHLRTFYVTTPRFREKVTELAENFKVLSKRINKLRTSWLAD